MQKPPVHQNTQEKNCAQPTRQQRKRGYTTSGKTDSSSDDYEKSYKQAQKSAVKMAQSISRTLRTIAYTTAWLSPWLEILVNNVHIMVSDDDLAARSGQGFSLQIQTIRSRADECRVSEIGPSLASMWGTMMSTLVSIWDKLVFKVTGRQPPPASIASPTLGQQSSPFASPRSPRPSTPFSDQPSSRREQTSYNNDRYFLGRYNVSAYLMFSGFEVLSGVDPTRGLYSSTWELVKMRLLGGFMVSSEGGGLPNTRRSLVDAFQASQDSIINLEMITTFWGLPIDITGYIDLASARFKADGLESLVTDCVDILRHYRTLHPLSGDESDESESTKARYRSWSIRFSDSVKSSFSNLTGNQGTSGDTDDGNLRDRASKLFEPILLSSLPQVQMHYIHSVLHSLNLEHIGFDVYMKDLVIDLPLTNKIPVHERLVNLPSIVRCRERDASVSLHWSMAANDSFTSNDPRSKSPVDRHSTLGASPQSDTDTRHRPRLPNISATDTSDMSSDSDSRKSSSSRTKTSRGRGLSSLLRSTPDLNITSNLAASWNFGSIQVTTSAQEITSARSVIEELDPSMIGACVESAELVATLPLHTSSFSKSIAEGTSNPTLSVDINIKRPSILLDLKTQLAFHHALSWIEDSRVGFTKSGHRKPLTLPKMMTLANRRSCLQQNHWNQRRVAPSTSWEYGLAGQNTCLLRLGAI